MSAAYRARLGAAWAETLSSLGAPDLPDHHLYRIGFEPHSDHVVRVEVRKLNHTTGSTQLSWATFSLRQGESNADSIVRACHEAYADAFPEGVPA